MLRLVKQNEVKEETLVKGNAKGVKVKHLIDERHGAMNFFLRLYEIEPGGETPYDQHPYEHEVYILKGRGHLLAKAQALPTMKEVKEGDSIFIASNQVHQFINTSEESFQMLCVKGAEHLYAEKATTRNKEKAPG